MGAGLRITTEGGGGHEYIWLTDNPLCVAYISFNLSL
jgi:hypothetical protein